MELHSLNLYGLENFLGKRSPKFPSILALAAKRILSISDKSDLLAMTETKAVGLQDADNLISPCEAIASNFSLTDLTAVSTATCCTAFLASILATRTAALSAALAAISAKCARKAVTFSLETSLMALSTARIQALAPAL